MWRSGPSSIRADEGDREGSSHNRASKHSESPNKRKSFTRFFLHDSLVCTIVHAKSRPDSISAMVRWTSRSFAYQADVEPWQI